MKFHINEIKLFIFKIVFINLATLGLIVTCIWYFISPRLWLIDGRIAIFSLALLRFLYIIVVSQSFLLLFTFFTEKPYLMPSKPRKKAFFFMYPSINRTASILKTSKDKIQQTLIQMNNSLMMVMLPKIKVKRILLLLPHCLQWFDCPYKITAHITNCRGCRKCVIADLIDLSKERNLDIAVATGGTIARRIVKETRPNLIIAVACERDLSSGILDTYPMPVWGILNIRPEGPCKNTQVDIEEIKRVLELLEK